MLTEKPEIQINKEMMERLLDSLGSILLEYGFPANIPTVVVEAVGLYANGKLYTTYDVAYAVDYYEERARV